MLVRDWKSFWEAGEPFVLALSPPLCDFSRCCIVVIALFLRSESRGPQDTVLFFEWSSRFCVCVCVCGRVL